MAIPNLSEPIPLEGGGLRITFLRHQDRIAHTIGWIEDGRLLPVLASHEAVPGEEVDPGRPSPPLQEITLEEHGTRRVALLVGKADNDHFSASVELDPVSRAATFDIACRSRRSDTTLGSSYRAMVPPDPTDSDHLVRLSIDELALEIEAIATPEAPLELTPTESGLTLIPAQQPSAPPHTVRWKYVVRRV